MTALPNCLGVRRRPDVVAKGGLQISVDTQERHVAGLQVQVARTAFDGESEQFVDVHPRLVVGKDGLGPERG
jgi:hypothetical protein